MKTKQKGPLKQTVKVLMVTFAMIFLFANIAQAAERIQAVRVEGAQRIDPATVLSYIDLQAGDQFDSYQLNSALKRLYDTGMFADVSLYQEGRDLVIAVTENPIINEIRFEGNEDVDDGTLSPEVQLKPRTVLTRSKVQADVDRLETLYRLSGRFSASVVPKIIKLDQNRVNLVFEITEGPKTHISRIRFLGNKRFDDGKLLRVVRSKEDRWWRVWGSDDNYDPDRLDYDRELLRRYYIAHGYADFRVENAVAELSADRKYFYVTFMLNEGERYKVRTIHINSNLPGLNADDLKSSVTFKKGDWYNSKEVDLTIDKLTDKLGNLQYAFVDVVPTLDRDEQGKEKVLDVTFTINPGRKIFIENINVTGNVRTLDEVVRREMLVIEGDPFNRDKIKKSEQRIKDLAFFEKVELKPVQGSSPDKADIDVTVSEKSTGALSIGAGYSTSDGVLGAFQIRERNFLGKGQDLSFSTTLASQRTEFDLSFTEPYFLKRDLSAGFDLFHVTRDYQDESSYDSRQTGAGLRFGYPLADHWRQGLAYRFTVNDIRNVPATASTLIQQQEGRYSTSLIGQSLVYDTTDSRLDPTEGTLGRIANELSGLGGDSAYFKTRVGLTQYYPIIDKWVLSLVGEAGYVIGYGGKDVRINERFYIGGDNLRGFKSAGIGPRDAATDDALGGNAFWRGSVQVDMPSGLPEDLGVRLHAFTDFGSLFGIDGSTVGVDDDEAIRLSAGVGATWRSPMGPVAVDFGIPLLKEEYDETEIFRFSLGTRF